MTEGEKTEPNYFSALRNRLQLAIADVEIVHPAGTDPLTLMRHAIAVRDARKKQAKNGFTIEYDEVWVVFDLEKPHDHRRKLATEAMALKEAKGIQSARSDPCFEYWLLLHEEYTTAPFSDCDSVIKRLERHWSGYAKGAAPPVEFIQKLPTAVLNSERCRQYHKDSGGDGNPSTNVDVLARNLNHATRSHLQFRLTSQAPTRQQGVPE